MENWIITRALKFMGGKLDGYKTKIGGLGFILLGLLGIVRVIFPDQNQLPDMGVEAAFGSIAAGMTALGIGGKADKLTAAVKSTTPVIGISGASAVDKVTQQGNG